LHVAARSGAEFDGDSNGDGEVPLSQQDFFKKKKAAAYLKHEILKYLRPFIAKTGKYSPGNRVVIMDGFAGSGRYLDGAPGSPVVIAEAAKGLDRKVECHFVEKDKATYEQLCQVLEQHAGSIQAHPWHGTAEARLPYVLERANGLPLFLFIDPYKTGPLFDEVVDIFNRRPGGTYAPATEILLRIDASGLRRTLGVHRSVKRYAGRTGALKNVDTVAGGTWWRDEADPTLTGEPYLEWFFGEYLHRLTTAVGCGGWYTEIKQKREHQPLYYLVFLTRRQDAAELFGDNLSSAMERWRKKVFDMEQVIEQEKREKATGQFLLIDPEEQFQLDEEHLKEQWYNTIEQNLRALLRKHEQFVIRQHYAKVLGPTAGLVRQKHLRVVLQRLEADGLTSSNSKGDLYGKLIIRAANAQP
jgi:three-Cys-motif partner protein